LCGGYILAWEGDRKVRRLILIGDGDTLVGEVFDEIPHTVEGHLSDGETGLILGDDEALAHGNSPRKAAKTSEKTEGTSEKIWLQIVFLAVEVA
jgi:hypothetical protein